MLRLQIVATGANLKVYRYNATNPGYYFDCKKDNIGRCCQTCRMFRIHGIVRLAHR